MLICIKFCTFLGQNQCPKEKKSATLATKNFLLQGQNNCREEEKEEKPTT